MYFTEERIGKTLKDLFQCIHSGAVEIDTCRIKYGKFTGGEENDLDTASWDIFSKNDRWGGKDIHCWFRISFEVPHEFDEKPIVLEVRTGREGDWDALNPQFMAYVNGKLAQGLDVNHTEVLLTDNAVKGETLNIALYAYSGMKEGLVSLNCRVSVLEKDVEKLFYDLKVPYEVAKLLDKEDKRRIDILEHLNEAINRIDFRKPFSDSFHQSVREAGEYIEQEYYNKYCGNSDVTALCIGHTHIDVAWLWTLDQTREKVIRSFSTVLNLMKQYPEYIFMSSQPQLYKFVKEDHPVLYEEIKQRIAEGRWEPEGAMWLEADCNLASGESLVRQILFGTRFFEKEFGVRSKILWLPDVFGYSAVLPQILKKSGIDYFMTSKISWNEYNKMPCDTFMWKGLDGTEILTHFLTAQDYNADSLFATYNASLVPTQVMGAWKRYKQKALNDEVLITYGYGDGGGGPTKEMLENARRMEKGIPGCPKVKLGTSLDFFKSLESKVSGNKKLPKWVGELYLEFHRGTYTSMARNKKFNRKCELLYQDAEFFSWANSFAASCEPYPADKLNRGWETILLNQFHDILPGSSIKEVYEDSKEQYLEVLDNGHEILDSAIGGIAGNIRLQDNSLVIFNPLSHERNDTVEFDLPEGYDNAEVYDSDGNPVPIQCVGGKAAIFVRGIPSKGYKSYVLKKAAAQAPIRKDESLARVSVPSVFSNKFFDIKFNDEMHIVSIYDRVNNREVLKPGEKSNVLQAFEDRPFNHDAWDINLYYQEKMWEINSLESVEAGPAGSVSSSVIIKRKFMDSVIKQEIIIYNEIPRIDFRTTVDWKERHILLKAAFPVDVNAEKATYEIQYGNVERPTHWNTSWDQAKFEVCAHKWADLSEDGYGVSLLNDCKYGYDIKDGIMRLTLIKSATEPNTDADRELHEFTYSLYPHKGGFREAGTIKLAYELNCPMYARVEFAHDGNLPSELSFLKIDRENVIIEVVKKAEDSDELVVRLYECHNRRTTASVTFFRELLEVCECDLMENKLEQLDFSGNVFSFDIRPYEIKTFMLRAK